jgi:putative ABC transport system ATP-binding protein
MTVAINHIPVLQVVNAWRSYTTMAGMVHAVREVNLSLYSGDYAAFVGPSGSGKSTLMGLMGLLDRPTQGEILMAGHATRRLTDGVLARLRNERIGFVFQQFNLLNRKSALHNVELPLLYANIALQERRMLAMQALERVGLAERVHHRPLALSGGQQQRVAIARALVANPSLLLADEPTGALDQTTSSQLLDLFDSLNAQGVTIALITHDAQVAKRAKRCFMCCDGMISEQVALPPAATMPSAVEEPAAIQAVAEALPTSERMFDA